MKKLYFILLIVLIVSVADGIVGAVTGRLIKNVPDVGLNQTNTVQALFNRKSDILILGSSKANHSFDPRVITALTGRSCYNAGRDGMCIAYDECVLKSYLERCTPKVVILDLTDYMMDGSWNRTLSDMYCYYGLSPAVDQVVSAWSSPIRRLQLECHLYRYNKTFEWLAGAYHSADQSRMNGYRPFPVNEDAEMHVRFFDKSFFKADRKDLRSLQAIVQICKDRHILLLLTIAPSLNVSKDDEFADWVKSFARQHHLRAYDFSHDRSYYSHADYFYDYRHLNERGARVFSIQIGQGLNRLLRGS